MNKTAIIVLILVGVVLITGCVTGPSDDGTTDSTATTDQVMTELDQELIDETSSVEIGDMV